MVLNERVFENVGRIYFKDNVCYLVFFDGADIDIQTAKLIVREKVELFQNRNYLELMDVRNLKGFSHEVGKYAASKEATKGVIAIAVLVDSLLSKMIANFYLKIYQPSIPVKIFSNEDEALKWLNCFK